MVETRSERSGGRGRRGWRTAALVAVAGLLASPTSGVAGGEDAIPFSVAEIYFELNDTDGDLGIHGLIDGEPWKRLLVSGPNSHEDIKVKLKGPVGQQGLTEFFFESAEPDFEELEPDVFFRRFPEGEYSITGRSIEGDNLASTTTLTHLVPAPPGNVRVSGQPFAEDCDEGPVPVVADPVVLSWDPVTLSHPDLGRTDEPITVVRYQVVVEQEDLGAELSVLLPPGTTQFMVPADFIALGSEFKFEILAREASGNQTALESCFEVD